MSKESTEEINSQQLNSRPPGKSSHLRAFWNKHALPKAWYLLMLAVLILATTVFFIVPSDIFPFTLLRAVLGLVFVMFLPGFALVKGLFPKTTESGTETNLNIIERLGLSIGMSLAITVITVLILNWTSLGVAFVPVFIVLLSFVVFCSLVALIRELSDFKDKEFRIS
jgi:uncharacterized membrane protein